MTASIKSQVTIPFPKMRFLQMFRTTPDIQMAINKNCFGFNYNLMKFCLALLAFKIKIFTSFKAFSKYATCYRYAGKLQLGI